MPSAGGNVASRSCITSSGGREASCRRATFGVHLQQLTPRPMTLADIPTHHCYNQFILR